MKMRFSYLMFSIIVLFLPSINAQEKNLQEEYILKIKKSSEKIQLDGILDEVAWQTADIADDMWLKWPKVEAHVNPKMETKMTYDDEFLYVGFKVYYDKPLIVKTLKRDKNFFEGDGVSVILDPVNIASNGFLFGISPYNVQSEALLSSSVDQLNFDWNNKWFSEVKRYDGFWIAEIAIPFKTLRYNSQNRAWGINVIRNYSSNSEYHTWTPVPLQYWGIDLNYTGKLEWDESPPKSGRNISLIPYISGGLSKDYNKNTSDNNLNIGLDGKIAINSSLNLDFTVNPDFSQVEVDRQVTNLSRYSIFFPEKRTFFLENSDLFSRFGIPPLRPFFSRRIGIQNGETVPILYGLRLTGNISPSNRIGLMNIQTRITDDSDGQNYSAATFQNTFWGKSTVRALLLNRQAFDDSGILKDDYGRNLSLETTLVSKNNEWTGWAGYHHSMKKDISNENMFVSLGGYYNDEKLFILQGFDYVGTNYYADMGFISRINVYDESRDTVIRQGFAESFTKANYTFYPKSEKIKFIKTEASNFISIDRNNKLIDRSLEFAGILSAKNDWRYEIKVGNDVSVLKYPFSFSFSNKSFEIGEYSTCFIQAEMKSDTRKRLNFGFEGKIGGFYNGIIKSIELSSEYRVEPWGNFGVDFLYNKIELAEGFGQADLWLIQPKFEVSFSNDFHWTTFFQFNTDEENFNINSRLQWRFAPMSDLYLVYTDNYLIPDKIESFIPQNKAIILKINYWLSL